MPQWVDAAVAGKDRHKNKNKKGEKDETKNFK
jgi:hypothetical protein